MLPNELYERVPESEYSGPEAVKEYILMFSSHIPELGDLAWTPPIGRCERVTIKVYKDFDFDGRRFWRLASVWLDDKPVMIIRNAGREGDDFSDRIVTNKTQYACLIAYLISQFAPDPANDLVVVDPTVDIPSLDEFYNNSLNGHFERYSW